jgi:ribosomal-protein-alanine N-acetyltransferase
MPAEEPVDFSIARPSDAGELAAIAEVSFSDPWSAETFRGELARERTRACLARVEGIAAGYALGWRVLGEAELLSLAVAPAQRGRGMGAALLGGFLEALRAEGVALVQLEVRVSNRAAQQLYRNAGMAVEGERPGYYKDGEAALLFGASLP